MTEKPLKPEEARKIIERQLPDDVIEPTAEEARNGWTAETLTAYHREVLISEQMRINPVFRPKRPPMVQNNRYSPLRWRR